MSEEGTGALPQTETPSPAKGSIQDFEFKRPKLGFGSSTNRLELDEGTWVEYRVPAYEEYIEFSARMRDSKGDEKQHLLANLELVQLCLTGWSDEEVPYTKEAVRELAADVIIYIASELMKRITPQKKS